MNSFEETINSFITEQGILHNCKKVLVAVSGGVDSVALLSVLCNLKKTERSVAHINHNLRGQQSDGDEIFVKQLAKKLDIEVFTESVNVKEYAAQNALSIETAARNLRMSALQKFVLENNFDAIVTGHHKDDNAETMIHRLMRGTGFKGLGGINPQRELNGITFVSPMLCVSRSEIVEYAKENKLAWREDHTNAECEYTRNKIRHLLIPSLQKDCASNLSDDLAELSDRCRGLNSKIAKQVEILGAFKMHPTGISINIETLSSQYELVQVEMIRQLLQLIGCGLRYITAEHYANIIGLCGKESAKKIELPGGFIAVREHEIIVISKSEIQNPKQISNPKQLPIGKQIEFGDSTITSELLNADECNIEKFIKSKDAFIEWFDFEKIELPLVVRNRQKGDQFRPIGTNSDKKVGKFITASKADYSLRDEILIFADQNKIVWISPLRASEISKVTAKTRKILQINVSQRCV